MYIPSSFAVTDPLTLLAFVRENSFGTLFSQSNGLPYATHLPFVVDEGGGAIVRLRGHMAKANPQWRNLDGAPVLAVFQGPHAFIAANWYRETGVVPTWNYVAVHVNGMFRVIEDKEELRALIRTSLDQYEPDSYVSTRLHNQEFDAMLGAVVGFAVDVVSVEGKWKLSQNHSVERRTRVIEALRGTGEAQATQIAELMEGTLNERE